MLFFAEIFLTRRHGANFAKLNFQKCSEYAALPFFAKTALARRRGVNFAELTSKSVPALPVFYDFDFQIAFARRRGANFIDILSSRSSATLVFRG